jgi:hypothetical protein
MQFIHTYGLYKTCTIKTTPLPPGVLRLVGGELHNFFVIFSWYVRISLKKHNLGEEIWVGLPTAIENSSA